MDDQVAMCPDCDYALGVNASYQDMSKLETLAIDSSVFICANCGAFIGVEAANCGACGAKRTPLTAEIEVEGSNGTLSDAVLESGGSPEIFLCDNCGAFLSDNASECEICGMNYENLNQGLEEEYDEGEGYELPENNIIDDMLHNEGALYLCKNCGAFIKSDAENCSICGDDISSQEDLALDDSEQLPTADEKLSSTGVLYLCEKCGAFMKDDATECPFCKTKKNDVIKGAPKEYIPRKIESPQIAPKVAKTDDKPKKRQPPRPKKVPFKYAKTVNKNEVVEDCLKMWCKKAVALKQMGKPMEALKALNYALDLNSADKIAILEKADLLYQYKDFIKAAQLYKQILKYEPENIEIWNKLGNTLYRLGNEDESLLCYEKSLSLDSRNKEAIINKGYILMKQERWDEAVMIADNIAS